MKRAGVRASVVAVAWLVGCGEPDGGAEDGATTGTTAATSATGETTSTSGATTTAATSTPTTAGGDSATSGSDSGTSSGPVATTGEVTAGDPGTGGGMCEDPQAPACSACNRQPGEPRRLIGLTWNYAMGAPGSGLGLEELRCIVPETGETGLIAGFVGMDWLPVGSNAFDRATGTLYALAYANSDNITRVFSIDTIHGVLIASPPTEVGLNWSGGLHVRSDGALVGVTWNAETMQEEVRVIDPSTGQSSFVGAVFEIASLYQAFDTFDPAADVAYMIGHGGGLEGQRLFVIDAIEGVLIGAPVFAAPVSWTGGIHVRADGSLLGVAIVDGVQTLLEIDVETAAVTTIAARPELAPIPLGMYVYDEVANTIDVVDQSFHLFQIDASSGALVASPKLDAPNAKDEYNWSGGLHVR